MLLKTEEEKINNNQYVIGFSKNIRDKIKKLDMLSNICFVLSLSFLSLPRTYLFNECYEKTLEKKLNCIYFVDLI